MVEAVPFEERHFDGVCQALHNCGLDFDREAFRRHFFGAPEPSCAAGGVIKGVVLTDGPSVVGFQGLVARELFFGAQPKLAYEMGALGIEKDYRFHVPLMSQLMNGQTDAAAFYGNTVNGLSARMHKALRFKEGPGSCALIRYRVLSWPAFVPNICEKVPRLRRVPRWAAAFGGWLLGGVMRLLRPLPRLRSTTVSRVLPDIDAPLFSAFWKDYLAFNAGVVSSRSPDVLTWLFGPGLRRGEHLLVGRFDGASLAGYIVLRKNVLPDGKTARYFVADWIARKNDEGVLADLLHDACAAARERGGAVLEILGYPAGVQGLIGAYLPMSRPLGVNTFMYKTHDSGAAAAFAEQADAGWFWGAFEADRCVMC